MTASAGDIYEVKVDYVGPGGKYLNTFGFLAKQAVAGDAQTDLGAAFQTAMIKNTSGGLLYGLASTVSVSQLRVEDVHPGLLATYTRTFSAVAGSNAGDALPAQCALVYKMVTTLKGRSFRGRFYLPGLTEDEVTAGTLNGASVTSFTTIITQLLAVFGPSGSNANWILAVISRYNSGIKRAVPVATDVSNISLDPIIHTQRRRVFGVGS